MKPCCQQGQGFGQNLNNYKPLLGHPAIDHSCGYGSEILATWGDEYVYKVLTKDQPANDGSGFTGVFTIVDNEIECFEFLYGHCNPGVSVGQILPNKGHVGYEANNGEVYSDGIRITLQMQRDGDRRGSHRHDQKRILRKDKEVQPNTTYLSDREGRLYYNGYYYAVPYYKNGYNGCVDWTLPMFNRNLSLGMSGHDIQCLQNFLKKKGFFDGVSTTFYGPKTLAAVRAFQKANGISPALGFFGPATRALANNQI